MYDYHEAVLSDVKQWIEDNEYYITEKDRDSLSEYLNDTLWTADSVTGNGSGSYTFNTYEAGCNLAGNFDLLREAVEEFGGSMDVLKDGEEACDVTIRCYLLGQCIEEALDELEEAGFFKDEDEDEDTDNIDFWYNNNPEEVTDIACYWADLDGVYRGNFFIDGKVVGDFTVNNSESLRDIVPQCFEIPFC